MRRQGNTHYISSCLLVCGACVVQLWTMPLLAAQAAHPPQEIMSTRVTGEVLYRSTRQPVADAEVRLSGDTTLTTRTRTDGRFEFSPVAKGRYGIEVFVRNSLAGSATVYATDVPERVTILLDSSGQGASSPLPATVAVRELQIPGRALTAFRAGLHEIEKGRPHRSVTHFERAITIHADYDEAYVQLALVLLDQGRLDDAIATLQKALNKNAENYRACALLGSVFYRAERLDEAEPHLRRSIRISDTLAAPHFDLARILLIRNAPEEALVHALRAHELNESDIQNHILVYNLHLMRRDAAKALAELDEMLERFADHPDFPRLRRARERLLSSTNKH